MQISNTNLTNCPKCRIYKEIPFIYEMGKAERRRGILAHVLPSILSSTASLVKLSPRVAPLGQMHSGANFYDYAFMATFPVFFLIGPIPEQCRKRSHKSVAIKTAPECHPSLLICL